jgi:hypothetical protein
MGLLHAGRRTLRAETALARFGVRFRPPGAQNQRSPARLRLFESIRLSGGSGVTGDGRGPWLRV